ncbi:lengsin-like [Lytechinus variegatus]|uniref:lengsin-like n=1 Tax=Lytechinus variegatus TaxID=7654 RepID=UPI001BB13714|nr:lengsin-like [Lytechinus variegatus]
MGAGEESPSKVLANKKVLHSKELLRVVNDVKDKGIKVLRVEFTDINGITRCKMVAVNTLEELSSTLKKGVLFSPICFMKDPVGEGFECDFKKNYWFSDMCALPDLRTFRVIPWLEDTAAISTVLYHLNMKDPVVEHPRNVANKQLQRLKGLGLSLLSAYELEFRLCGSDGEQLVKERIGFCASSVLLVTARDYIKQLFDSLPRVGVTVDAIHSESPDGSLEVSTKPSFGIKAADEAVICKDACSEIALCNGYKALFIADPDGTGSGFTLHLNHSLWDKSGNVVFNATTDDLSDTAKYWIAGLLAHARALTPLMASTVSGIKMFGAYERVDSVEPSYVSWGKHNRSATFRVKKSDGPSGSYIENRLGRIDADPYLILAGTVAAGMDGIVNKIPLPGECLGNAHKDIPSNTPKVPCDMKEGLAALVQDEVLCDALGQEFIDLLVAARKYEMRVHNED